MNFRDTLRGRSSSRPPETPVVFVVDPASEVVRKTPVILDGTSDGGVRIAGGVQAGDTVVSAGVQFLSDGMRVKLPDSGQP